MKNLKIIVIPIPQVVFFPHTSMSIFIDTTLAKVIESIVANNEMVAITKAKNEMLHLQGAFEKICTVGKPIILEKLRDGGLKILIKCSSRARLLRPLQNLPYPIYEAELLPDLPDQLTSGFLDEKIERLTNILNSWLIQNIPDPEEREILEGTLLTTAHSIDYISAFLIKDMQIKQILLENDSLDERIQILDSLLSDSCPFDENKSVVRALKDFEHMGPFFNQVAH